MNVIRNVLRTKYFSNHFKKMYKAWYNESIYLSLASQFGIIRFESRRLRLRRQICYILYCLWFEDLTYSDYRRLVSNPNSLEIAGQMMNALEEGYQSWRKYDFQKWLNQRNVSHYKALPYGNPVLALMEGCETIIKKRISEIEKTCYQGCGCYFELFEVRVLRELRNMKSHLSRYELSIFERVTHELGYNLSDEYLDSAETVEQEIWEEILG